MTDNYIELSFDRQVEILEFYALSQRYGFCTPFCECGFCGSEEELIGM